MENGNMKYGSVFDKTFIEGRQEWKISLDASTGRYKIVNVEDSRYLNEKGVISGESSI